MVFRFSVHGVHEHFMLKLERNRKSIGAAALSFPLAFCWCVRRLVELQAMPAVSLLRCPKLRIVAAGCTHRLEQRILAETNCFHELEHYFPCSEIKLCMVGPEIRVPKHKVNFSGSSKKGRKAANCEWTKETDRFSWCLSQSTVKDYLKVKAISYTVVHNLCALENICHLMFAVLLPGVPKPS